MNTTHKIILLIGILALVAVYGINAFFQNRFEKKDISFVPTSTSYPLATSQPSPTVVIQNQSNPAIGINLQEAMGASPDSDGDGLKDVIDNCPLFVNPDQKDTDQSGVGDDCEVFEMAKEDLAFRLAGHRSPSVLGIWEEKITEIAWPNSCIGFKTPGEVCATVITPGYKVIFAVNGKKYLYHTDKFTLFRFAGEQK